MFFDAPAGSEPSATPGLERLLADRPAEPDGGAGPRVEVTAILAGGLPPERRSQLARAAVRRLAGADCSAPLVVFGPQGAAVQTMRPRDDAPPDAAQAAGSAGTLHSLIRSAGRLILLVEDRAAAYLDAGRQLPDHCIILATPDAESLVEAYRELKTATGATLGPVPEVFVLDAADNAGAERAYRRIARVAIAHLSCTPTYAGRCLGSADPQDAPCCEPVTLLAERDADRVYRLVRPHVAGAAQPPAATSRPRTPEPSVAVEVAPTQPAEGRTRTLPPIAGVVNVVPARAAAPLFTTWQAASAEQLMEAVEASIAGLLPEARGLLATDGLIEAAEQPDAIAVDRAGRPVALLLAEGPGADVLRRAVDALAWLKTYGPLLARAFPQAGLDPQPGEALSIVLAPEGVADDLESLCPPRVGLAAYVPVACGEVRGLLFRHVLRPVEARGHQRPGDLSPGAESAAPPDALPPMSVTRRSVAATTAADAPPVPLDDGLDDLGSSPDDDLSADEINDLKGPFEIDELT